MSKKDIRRKWMWLILVVIASLQIYAVRELLAAFALFVLGFASIAFCVAALYLVQKGWEAGVARAVVSRNPLILAGRRSVTAFEDWSRRTARRPGSEPAR